MGLRERSGTNKPSAFCKVIKIKPYASLSVLLIFLLLLTFCSIAPVHASPTWNVQTLDTNTPDLGGYCPIVLDSNGYPHIAYTSNDLGGVVYASWNGSGWNIQKVANGTAFDLAVDANNNPYILYDGLTGGLMYATWTGTNWASQTVDKNGGAGSIALDSAGNPHIAYFVGDNIEYAGWTGTDWNTQTVDTVKTPFRISLAINSNNTAYLLYSLTDEVELAVQNNSGWSIQSVASNMDSLGNLALDSKGYPHFIYSQDYTNYTGYHSINITIMYASWNGATWNTQQVVSNVSEGGIGDSTGIYTMASLALDSRDNPHIVYVTSAPEDTADWGFLAYASWTGKTWNTQTVNSSIVVQSCNLAIDRNGNPHISLVGVVQGSQAEELTGAYSWIAPVMYATTTEQATFPSVPEFQSIQPLVIGVLVAVAVVAIWAAVSKKKKIRSE